MTEDDDALAWWRQASRDERVADFERLRRAHKQRRKELEARYPLLDADGWLKRVDQLRTETSLWALAVKFKGLPYGAEGSGLVLLSKASLGRLWWSSRRGLSFILLDAEPNVELASGHADVPAKEARSLWRACRLGARRGIEDVPSRCYDGVPSTVILRDLSSGRTLRACCNAAGPGREPALVLARSIIGAIEEHCVIGWGACSG
jgi:hypothetical protein